MELLLTVSRDRPDTLRTQIEVQLRTAIRDGSLRPATVVPSTRDLAAQLGCSRRVVADAYAQLAAEGYLALRQGARPRVADGPFRPVAAEDRGVPPERSSGTPRSLLPDATPPVRFDFRPARPDVSAFPREAWSRCLRDAVGEITVADLGYGDPFGVDALRESIAGYLGRVRGVVADPACVVVTNGYLPGLGLVCRALAARGARRIALEDPSSWDHDHIVARAGLEPVRVPVDDRGLRVDLLDAAHVQAVVLTPAHQHPTGVVLTPGRRAELVTWLRRHDAIAIEDDYDAEYRYDRPAVGALQGLDRDHVVYAGTASKVLAPALRLGWMVVPAALAADIRHERMLSDQGTARIEQLAFARFLERGDLDRHLRRMRLRYRARRDVMIEALAADLPGARVCGIAAGLHVTVELPGAGDETGIRRAAGAAGIALGALTDYRTGRDRPATLILGYAQMSEGRIRGGVHELARVIRDVRRSAAGTPAGRPAGRGEEY
ncbi:MocR-like pyridoxine biosynthesis transcription factor PdxR [Jidongwangia harbinensis]|uniref:MocR-like pyridoxine biosynthesis transcription factor PdxR n=1 Tax=Jidongwangia harbinensis TaxID=2878561 RepID=UPI001CD9CD37|nr:PLP-dependent aminotransferase family protein [Jidongwangia harbinensis]MCA2217165.1 PLP-dependent aminotransferase family protein [Jidongwangia harbinensis]